jgi:hypothetical protein
MKPKSEDKVRHTYYYYYYHHYYYYPLYQNVSHVLPGYITSPHRSMQCNCYLCLCSSHFYTLVLFLLPAERNYEVQVWNFVEWKNKELGVRGWWREITQSVVISQSCFLVYIMERRIKISIHISVSIVTILQAGLLRNLFLFNFRQGIKFFILWFSFSLVTTLFHWTIVSRCPVTSNYPLMQRLILEGGKLHLESCENLKLNRYSLLQTPRSHKYMLRPNSMSIEHHLSGAK